MRLAGVIAGQGPNADVALFDDMVIQTLIQREVGNEASPLAGREPAELLEALEPRRGPERVLDFMLRSGPYGDGFGERSRGSHARPARADPARDRPRDRSSRGCRRCCARRRARSSWRRSRSSRTSTACAAAMARERNGGMVLIGRRQLRSNNSWMHNLPALVKGKERCTLHIHPDDAERLGLADGEAARISSAAGSLEAPVETTEDIMPGVVSHPARLGPRRRGRPDGRGVVARRA